MVLDSVNLGCVVMTNHVHFCTKGAPVYFRVFLVVRMRVWLLFVHSINEGGAGGAGYHTKM